MPLVIPVDHYVASFHHSIDGTVREAVCTLGVNYVGSDFGNNANDLRLAWSTTVMTQLTSNIHYIRFTLAEQAGIVNDFAMTTIGGNLDSPAPPNVAYLVKKHTAAPGRHNRGRFYLPGVDEDGVTSTGELISGTIGTVGDAINDFYDAAQAANFQPVILHQTALAPTNVVNFALDRFVATQRRRLRG